MGAIMTGFRNVSPRMSALQQRFASLSWASAFRVVEDRPTGACLCRLCVTFRFGDRRERLIVEGEGRDEYAASEDLVANFNAHGFAPYRLEDVRALDVEGKGGDV